MTSSFPVLTTSEVVRSNYKTLPEKLLKPIGKKVVLVSL